MLAVSQGRLVCLSTPFGRQGWFYEEWDAGGGWERYRVPASQCPRIDPAFLQEEKEVMGRWYNQEYELEFLETLDALFTHDDLDRAFQSDAQPLFGESER
jgi:hypothetical protein